MGISHFFVKKFKKMKKIVKIVAFRGISGNSGGDRAGDGVLNSNHQGTGWGKMVGDLGEPRVPLGIPRYKRIFIRFFVCSNLFKEHLEIRNKQELKTQRKIRLVFISFVLFMIQVSTLLPTHRISRCRSFLEFIFQFKCTFCIFSLPGSMYN